MKRTKNLSSESNRDIKKARIELGVSNFVKLFSYEESVTVDKTMLIKEFWQYPAESLLMAFPRRWGKSINLDMINEFFSLKLDSKGNEDKGLHQKRQELFTKFKIGQTDLMSEYGKYPVIYIDMKSAKKGSYSELLDALKNIVSRLYEKYLYLTNEQSDLADYQKIEVKKYVERKQDLTPEDLSSSLLNISKLLKQYHSQPVIILMDEYDAAYNYVYTEPGVSDEERRKIVNFLKGFNENTFKGNEYLVKSLMTGVLRFAKDGSLSGLNHVKEHNITSKEFSQYYGFSQDEVDILCSKFGITDDADKEKISTWYNGYYQGANNQHVNVYCAWSIINYLNSGDFMKYWSESGSISFLNKLFSNQQIKHNIETLIKGGVIEFKFNDQLSADQFKKLGEMAHNASVEINSEGIDLFFSYMLVTGYLTQSDTSGEYKLPNYELTLEFEDKLLSFYKQIYTIDPNKMSQLTQNLSKIFGDHDSLTIKNLLTGDFYYTLKSVIEDCKLTQDKSSLSQGLFGNEDLVHSLLNYIALQVYDKKFATEIYTKKTIDGQVTDRSGRADIMLSHKKQGLIIEMKYTKEPMKDKSLKDTNASKSQEALNQAKTYSELIPGKAIDDYMQIFCGISISAEQDVALSGEIINPDSSNLDFSITES